MSKCLHHAPAGRGGLRQATQQQTGRSAKSARVDRRMHTESRECSNIATSSIQCLPGSSFIVVMGVCTYFELGGAGQVALADEPFALHLLRILVTIRLSSMQHKHATSEFCVNTS